MILVRILAIRNTLFFKGLIEGSFDAQRLAMLAVISTMPAMESVEVLVIQQVPDAVLDRIAKVNPARQSCRCQRMV